MQASASGSNRQTFALEQVSQFTDGFYFPWHYLSTIYIKYKLKD